MGERQAFSLFKNAFVLLGLDPTATLERVSEAYDDAISDEVASEAELRDARDSLLNPRQRLEEEVAFLLDTSSRETQRLLQQLTSFKTSTEALSVAARLDPLSRANFLAHLASQVSASADLLYRLLDAHAAVDADTIAARLKATRTAAGITVPVSESLSDSLHRLFDAHAIGAVAAFPSSLSSLSPVVECTNRILATRDSELVDALQRLLTAFESRVSPELTQIEKEFEDAAKAIRARPRDLQPNDPLIRSIALWSKLADPMLSLDAFKGRDQERARRFFVKLRSFSIDLANDHKRFQAARILTEAAASAFDKLPRASEQLKEDLETLDNLAQEALVSPLLERIAQYNSDYGELIDEIDRSGFGPRAKGRSAELWNLFEATARSTLSTTAASMPWALVRSIALAINNEDNRPDTAKTLLLGLLLLASDVPPLPPVLSQLKEDLRVIDYNAKEQALLRSLKAERHNEAIGLIDALLPAATSEQRQTLISLRSSVKAKQAKRWIGWGVAASIAVLVLIGALSDRKSGPSSPSSVPSSSAWTPPREPSFTTAEPTRPTLSLNQPTGDDLQIEDKPPPGQDRDFTRANLRYCMFQKARIAAMRQLAEGVEEVAVFNGAVNDYNIRCGSYRYRQKDLEAVQAELARRQSSLLEQGTREILSSRRSSDNTVPEPPTIPLLPVAPTTSPSPPEPETDLLQLEQATKVQRRLAELGYFRAPINGVWGPQSRAALGHFKVSSRLPSDDIFDATTALRLFSPTAVKASAAAPLSLPGMQSVYQGPGGASLNPLNREDAIRIHTKLKELGFYRASGLEVWTLLSRRALRDFKFLNGLPGNDGWDWEVEQRLMAARPPQTNSELDADFSKATAGLWSTDPRSCPGSRDGGDAALVRINRLRAETDDARCDFGKIVGAGSRWKVQGTCTVNGQVKKSDITLTRSADSLVWASQSGTANYQKCPD